MLLKIRYDKFISNSRAMTSSVSSPQSTPNKEGPQVKHIESIILRSNFASFSVGMIDLMVLILTPGDKVPHPEGTTAYEIVARRITARDEEKWWKEPKNARSYCGVKTRMLIHGHNPAVEVPERRNKGCKRALKAIS